MQSGDDHVAVAHMRWGSGSPSPAAAPPQHARLCQQNLASHSALTRLTPKRIERIHPATRPRARAHSPCPRRPLACAGACSRHVSGMALGSSTCLVAGRSSGSSSAASAVAWTGGASSVFALSATPTLKVTVLGRGMVTSSPAGIDCPKTCSAHFSTNSRVRLTAHPAAGWILFAWSGGCRGHRACVAKLVYREFVQAKFLKVPSSRPSNPG